MSFVDPRVEVLRTTAQNVRPTQDALTRQLAMYDRMFPRFSESLDKFTAVGGAELLPPGGPSHSFVYTPDEQIITPTSGPFDRFSGIRHVNSNTLSDPGMMQRRMAYGLAPAMENRMIEFGVDPEEAEPLAKRALLTGGDLDKDEFRKVRPGSLAALQVDDNRRLARRLNELRTQGFRGSSTLKGAGMMGLAGLGIDTLMNRENSMVGQLLGWGQ